MRQFVSSMSGWMVRRLKSISRWIRERPLNWLLNTVRKLVRAVCDFEYRLNAGIAMWLLRKRWYILVDKMPARRRLRDMEKDYWHLYDEYARLDEQYKLLHAKHMDLNDEVRYWETRHAKVLNYIEKQMENTEGDIFK